MKACRDTGAAQATVTGSLSATQRSHCSFQHGFVTAAWLLASAFLFHGIRAHRSLLPEPAWAWNSLPSPGHGEVGSELTAPPAPVRASLGLTVNLPIKLLPREIGALPSPRAAAARTQRPVAAAGRSCTLSPGRRARRACTLQAVPEQFVTSTAKPLQSSPVEPTERAHPPVCLLGDRHQLLPPGHQVLGEVSHQLVFPQAVHCLPHARLLQREPRREFTPAQPILTSAERLPKRYPSPRGRTELPCRSSTGSTQRVTVSADIVHFTTVL